MQKKKLFTVFLVLLFIMQLVPPTFSPKIVHSQATPVNEKQVACGDIVEGEFINNAEDHIYLLPMQPRENFDVALEPAGDDLKTLIAIYGPSGIRIKISGEYFDHDWGKQLPARNTASPAPKLVSGTLSARGLYKIRVINTDLDVENHQDLLNDKLIADNRLLGGVGAYRLFIGCTKADQTKIEPGDTAQPTAELALTPTEQVGAQISSTQDPGSKTLPPFLEVGQTYEIAFGSQTKIMKLVELRNDGWAKVEVESRVGWLNINQVALITPLID